MFAYVGEKVGMLLHKTTVIVMEWKLRREAYGQMKVEQAGRGTLSWSAEAHDDPDNREEADEVEFYTCISNNCSRLYRCVRPLRNRHWGLQSVSRRQPTYFIQYSDFSRSIRCSPHRIF